MRRMRMTTVLAVLVFVSPILSAAEVPAGSRVRVITKARKPIIGSLVASDAEALTVRQGKGEPHRVLVGDVIRLDVSRRPSRRGRGALIGLGVGVVGGAVLGELSNAPGCQPSEYNPCWFGTGPLFSSAESAGMGAVFFGGLGALIGAAVAPGEKWERIPDHRVRLGVAPARGGASLALSLRF